ncbi:hypothetical protein HV081_18425 [Enterobacter roggenkampii]|uniref:hypothetical protein n=1 Tax=Enterobacter roggenkampii TaxID=1812935 RepID=UPI0015E502FE|nr:hypothetical protein [Enterobacter roggenkampii]QLN69742.1 hypothetical protein HV081_18425 [Enterobacter roggenkampii]
MPADRVKFREGKRHRGHPILKQYPLRRNAARKDGETFEDVRNRGAGKRRKTEKKKKKTPWLCETALSRRLTGLRNYYLPSLNRYEGVKMMRPLSYQEYVNSSRVHQKNCYGILTVGDVAETQAYSSQ